MHIAICIHSQRKTLEGCGYVAISLGGQDNIMVILGKDSRTKLPEFEYWMYHFLGIILSILTFFVLHFSHL